MQVNILEAKNRLSQLIKSAQRGEEVVIANRGEPVARLVPTGKPSSTAAETGKGRAILDWLAAHRCLITRDVPPKKIDAAIEGERQSWD